MKPLLILLCATAALAQTPSDRLIARGPQPRLASAPSDMEPIPPMVSVSLAWDASPSAGVVGYKVYWLPVSNVPQLVIGGAAVSTTNTFLTVVPKIDGRTEFFATAVDGNGLESPRSESLFVVTAAPNLTLRNRAATESILASPMVVTNLGIACVTSPTDEQGTATFTLTTPYPADFNLFALTYALDGGANSFYVAVDGLEAMFDCWTNYGSWQWNLVRGLTNLPAGQHEIRFRSREAFTFLSEIQLTTRAGPVTNATPPAVVYTVWAQTNGGAGKPFADWKEVGTIPTNGEGLIRLRVGRQ